MMPIGLNVVSAICLNISHPLKQVPSFFILYLFIFYISKSLDVADIITLHFE